MNAISVYYYHYFRFVILLLYYMSNISNGCQMESVTDWNRWETVSVLDTFRGVFDTRQTIDILGLGPITQGPGLNQGPYVNVSLINSVLTLETNEYFSDYEENETSLSMSVIVTFNCVEGTPRSLTFYIEVEDTNNNDPLFKSSSNNIFEFHVILPLPRGFPITNWLNEIIVRDIDLTTKTIDFRIHDNALFHISNYNESLTLDKEFKASLTTTTLIRSIPETIEFKISATDVDETGDEPRTTFAIVRIVSDNEFELPEELSFTRTFYTTNYEKGDELILHDRISLQQGYHDAVKFRLDEDEYADYFILNVKDNDVRIEVRKPLSVDILGLGQILLVLRANREYTSGTSATVIVNLPREEELRFEKPIYPGAIVNNILEISELVLTKGYENDKVSIEVIHGYDLILAYQINQNIIILSLSSLNETVIEQNTFLNLQVVASNSFSNASTIVTLEIVKDDTFTPVFERAVYSGTYDIIGGLDLKEIVLTQGYDDTVTVTIDEEYKNVITIVQSGPIINLQAPILPPDLFKVQRLVFTLETIKPRTVGASAAIIISLIPQENGNEEELLFEKPNYKGAIVDGNLVLNDLVLTQGYENEQISINFITEYSTYFDYSIDHNTVALSMSPLEPNVIEENTFLNLQVVASTNSSTASTIVTLEIVKNDTFTPVFDRVVYLGTYDIIGGLDLEKIVLTQGYDDTVTVAIDEEYKNVITIVQSGPIINLLAPILPPDLFKVQRLVLTLEAIKPRTVGASAAIIISLIPQENGNEEELLFEKPNYKGAIVDGYLVLNDLVLTQGYENEQISIHFITVYSAYFDYSIDHNTVALSMSPLEPNVIEKNTFLILQVVASTNRSTASTIVTLEIVKDDTFTPVFQRAVYSGTYDTIEGLDLEEIVLTQGYDDTVTAAIDGEYKTIITIVQSGPNFTLQASNIPPELFNEKHLLLTLEASKPRTVGASTVIFITSSTDAPLKPIVTFSASSYIIRTEMGQTGIIGHTIASADNDESVIYSLDVDNDHLRSRLTITDNGELYLSEAADSGVYSFKVIGTTTVSQVVGSATVHLIIESVLHTCQDGNIAVAPLIVIDRDEEEPHQDLVVLDTAKHEGCHYTITNQWPPNQPWLYLNDTGLHARAIDREDPTIAFMALSQIQIELMLHCENNSSRNKRATRFDWLGPYDYGTNTWVLGNTIEYNPKKSIVNLIVNDINDNSPIFVGKENEPIAVGYPISHLQETILPQSLVELQASDADVGKNAAIVYWSLEPELAVSSKTGFVHVQNNAQVTHNKHLTVNATDLNGQGLTGSITLVVKLLDMSNIAVVTIRNAFLEDKDDIVGNLSESLGYEVKTLRADVISEYNVEELETTRNKRLTQAVGVSLQIYVYGLIEKEPVDVGKLLNDVHSAAATTVTILSLEDHLEGQQICGILGRDIGLLATTIVLSILLFILIVAAGVWFFLTRIKSRNYDQFSDETSLASQIESLGQSTKTNDDAPPRLNIEELKKSEKRLQNMINDPIENVSTEPSTSAINVVKNHTATDPAAPIITQDKLKYFEEPDNDDEFGEVKSYKRKSTVTFNENVEKIEHNIMDDRRNSETNTSFEIYSL